ncbi:MAG: mechanosensitive ion channel family protein [Acholeplasmatales bacterium]|jgi:small conductance mechanosensitive channel|nr:mechanosensitive ion channel family protein [Acholeplasmatales bacterium]
MLQDFLKEQFLKIIGNEKVCSALSILFMCVFWVLLGLLFSFIVGLIAKKISSRNKMTKNKRIQPKRANTIIKVIIRIIQIFIWFYVLVMILKTLGIDIIPIIASAGVVALAVGLGAQSLFTDWIAGAFIIADNSLNIGDVIEIDGFKGEVVNITFRHIHIKNWKGELKIISNGTIKSFINYTSYNSVGIVELNVKYYTDISIFNSDHFKKLLQDFKDKDDNIVSTPVFNGIVELDNNKMKLRFTFQAKAEEQSRYERQLREIIVNFCNEFNIVFPESII